MAYAKFHDFNGKVIRDCGQQLTVPDNASDLDINQAVREWVKRIEGKVQGLVEAGWSAL